MDSSKLIYWSLVLGMAALAVIGIRLAVFGSSLLERRGKIAEARLGKKGVAFFIGTIRVLALTVAILALYLFVNLLRIFPCAIK